MPLSRAEDFDILHDDNFFDVAGQGLNSNLDNQKTEIISPDDNGKLHLSQIDSQDYNNTNKSLGPNRSPIKQEPKSNNRGMVKNSRELGGKFRVLRNSKSHGDFRK
jgi:hypothetical protein